MKLVIQLPALNEEASIAQVLRSLPTSLPGIDEVVRLVVDDGSTDRTAELARAEGAVVVSHPRNRGVGMAFRTGIAKAVELGADLVVTVDADGQFDVNDIPKLLAPILAGEADFVTASRFLDPELVPEMPPAKRWGNDVIARWLSAITKQTYRDVSCGFRAYSRNAFLRLNLLGTFTYTHEVFLTLALAEVPIKELPVRVRGVREHGKSRVASNLFRYAHRTASIILKTYRDYRPLHFFGYGGIALAAVGIALLGFLAWFRWTTGGFSPHKWAAFVGSGFLAAAAACWMIGIFAEMLVRIRTAADESLFRIRRLEMQASSLRTPPAR